MLRIIIGEEFSSITAERVWARTYYYQMQALANFIETVDIEILAWPELSEFMGHIVFGEVVT
jgi:hypothetical protein